MSKIIETTVFPPEQTVKLSERDLTFAATNSPALAKDEFMIGGRTFKVLFLGYKRQLEFLALLQPLLSSVLPKPTGPLPKGIGLNPDMFSFEGLVQACAEDLPKMVAIICNEQEHAKKKQMDPAKLVDEEWIMDQEVTPLMLAQIVLKQIAMNRLIVDIQGFFGAILPVLMQLQTMKK